MIKRYSFILSMLLVVTFVTNSQVPPPPPLGPGEYYTDLYSRSYDYQTNGSIRYLVQDPSDPKNLCAILMSQKDSSDPIGTNRYIYFSYTTDGGKTWTEAVVNNSTNHGFPCMTVRNGTVVIACHRTGATGTFVYEDLLFGGFTFSLLGTFPTNPSAVIWPHIGSADNGNVTVAAAPNPGFQGHWSTYTTSWSSPLVQLTNTGGPSGNFGMHGKGTNIAIIGSDYNGNDEVRLWTSNNSGTSFTLETGSNAPPLFMENPFAGDTLFGYIVGGKQVYYDGSGNLHAVYAVYGSSAVGLSSPPNTAWYKKTSKIVHWSAATGVDTIASYWKVPNLADTITTALMNPVCQPTLGHFNGLLYCTFTAFLIGNVQTVQNGAIVNAGEIMISWSADGGDTWSPPVNLTNTPNIEEKHSSFVPDFVLPTSNDSLGVYYIRDMLAGGWVNVAAWGKAPVYGIYKKIGGPIGINGNSQVAGEFRLFQNYPNPFNPSTTISYYLPKSSVVTLKVYDVVGKEVATLVNEYQTSGAKEVVFNASGMASGIYYYSISADNFRGTKKMILIK